MLFKGFVDDMEKYLGSATFGWVSSICCCLFVDCTGIS